MDRDSKLRRLHYLGKKLPHMTASALAGVLEEVQKHGAIDLHQRKHIREATHKELSKYDEYGPMFCEVALEGEQPCTATIVNLHALLFAAFGQGGGFYKLLKDTMQKTPPTPHSPYQLILYSDEVVPGNVLSADNRRKCWLVYASIAQFGSEVLSQECAWLTLACCRSSFLTHCFAGIGQLMKAIIKNFFQNDMCDLQEGGILLKGPDGDHCRIWIQLGCLVQDGAAHRAVFSVKGDSGTRCCLLCRNIISKRSKLTNEEGGEILLTDNVKEADCVFTSDNDIWNSIQRLRTNYGIMCLGLWAYFLLWCGFVLGEGPYICHVGVCCLCHWPRSKADFNLWQQASGMNYQPHGLLFDDSLHTSPRPILKPASQFMHDWMHLMCVGGVCQTTIYLFLEGAGKKNWTEPVPHDCRVHGFVDIATIQVYQFTKLIQHQTTEIKQRSSDLQVQCF